MAQDLYPASHAAPKSGAEPVRVTWSGNPWSLTGLCFLNLLLIVITVGIYWFWARSEYRRHIWRSVRVQDEPLEYTGTGRELLIGYLLLFVLVILPIFALVTGSQFVLGPNHPLTAVIIFAAYIFFTFLYFAGVFRAHRYLLSRTRWRGIAFGLGGNAAAYSWTSIWTALLGSVTLGWIIPWRTTALRRRLTNAIFFGSARFRFEGSSGRLYGPFVLVWLGVLVLYVAAVAIIVTAFAPTFQKLAEQGQEGQLPPQEVLKLFLPIYGVILAIAFVAAFLFVFVSAWYEARKLNTFAAATKVDGLEGRLETHGGGLIALTLTNFLIMLFSLGILRPVAQARRLRYLVERFSWQGSADLAEIMRGQEQTSLQGAGLEVAFSIDVF